jgi:hypothetical protein
VASLFNLIRGAVTGRGAVAAPQAPLAEDLDVADLDRSPAEIHFDIALEYQKEGEWDEAIARYRQAIAHDERFAMAYYNLGLAYWAKGRLPLAASSFRAAGEPGAKPAIRIAAELRLRELERVGPDSVVGANALPEPLERGTAEGPDSRPAVALDPVVARRTWLRLAVGGIIMVGLAIAAWLFVTVATMGAMV